MSKEFLSLNFQLTDEYQIIEVIIKFIIQKFEL